MKKPKKTFLLYYDQSQIWDGLSDEQAGKLIKILHSNPNAPVIKDSLIKYAYKIIKKKIDTDYDKWLERCDKNKENIQKRWEKKSLQSYTTVFNPIQSDTKHTDNDNDNDNEL